MLEQEKLKFFDIAHEGAFARATAEAVASGAFDTLLGVHPRSVVVVCSDEASRLTAELAVALREPLDFPIQVVNQLPLYCGPLDVVLVVGSTGPWGAEVVVELVAEASRRGCITLCIATHVWEEPPRGVLMIPGLPGMGNHFSLTRVAATVWAVAELLAGAQAGRSSERVAESLAQCADTLDEDIQALSPQRDAVVNPARSLRHFVHDGRVVHVSYSTLAARIANLVSMMWAEAGLVSACLSAQQLELALPALEGPERDIFYDPFLDGDSPQGGLSAQHLLPLRVVVWAPPADLRKMPPHEGMPAHTVVQQCEQADAQPLAAALMLVIRAWAASVFQPTDDAT